MINKENFKAMLRYLKFEEKGRLFRKDFEANGVFLEVDFVIEQLVYPEIAGLIVNERQTCNFSQAENAVVFECVNRLLEKGYKPEHLELEPKWKVGHGASGGRADILVKDHNKKPMLLIECKTYDKEFTKAWRETLEDGGQLFSYAQQISETEFLCLYASEFDDKNNTLNMQQRIISHKDNEKLLEKLEKPKTYKKASNVKNRYEVWKETYQQEYTETGIFEHNIQAYQIGKSKYTLDIDTRPIAETDIEGKYHRFRTILRQHNIARKETAFEVLVNLFLSKIVDEEENKTDLKFFWKGIAYDNYFDFVDRLQNLYQVGMKKFLDDEITYISNDQIDNAFWTVKNKRNATKKTIQEYFRKLKFFSNNAFSFINVHNERLFNKNAKVLVEIVQMWQSLRLKTKEQNQFLGDMFEYFLDNSIKQSEGQFFTPLPICKFIVMSLPLETKIQESSEPLRAIDYACGAGHFLTEYAHQIRPLLKKYKEIEPGDYYKNIFGIEKEDRLAKVAKVSAYMYGQDQINIVEEDALTEIQQIKNESFDVLVANPPFAVEGFLHNLSEKQKDQYELIQTTGYKSNTSNIQCFFIERAKQLMAPNGTVGIIVPSSVLSNSDSTHIMTREIILKYFDIISIVELGSGTFGKTGTNTVVLFLRRKPQKPEPAEHYRNRVEDYFEGIEENDQNLTEYQDLYLIKKYCEHTDLPFEEYKKLFGITPKTIGLLDELLKTDIFKEYKTYFDNSAEIKNLKTKTAFKKLSKEEQKTELNKRLINYLFAIEKDKLYYFMLAYENKQKVLVVKCPSGNKEVKQFLGYEWSGAKGSEGIRYNGGSTVNDIITDLFDPKNAQNYKKINYLIQQNFNGVKPDIDLKGFDNIGGLINYTSLMDILDFSRKDFNKAFSLAPKQTITIDTKWDLVKLGAVCEDPQYGANESAIDGNPKNDYRYIRITDIDENGYLLDDFKTAKNIEEQYILKDGDFLFARSGNTVGKTFLYKTSYGKAIYAGYLIRFRTNKSKLLPEFLNEFTNTKIYKQWVKHTQTGTSQPNINGQMYSGLLIPLPPLNIQQKIVQECEIIVKQSEQARKAVDEVKKEIENEFNSAFNQASKILRLSDSRIFDLSIGKRVLQKEIEQSEGIPVYSANVFEPFGFIKKELLKDFSKSSVIWGIDGDWMVNYMPANKPFYPTDHCGVVRVKNDVVHPRYLAWVL
ncbi:MAG: N-6 DNA methylase, partial [Ignavibacteriales bacterium]|nr:N-6 DNA methylase [Ignavibacteriales bacterium]